MNITFFCTCLLENLFPGVAKAAVELLETFGHRVRYHAEEICCGQMAFNAGYRPEAKKLAAHLIACLADDEIIVTPSGSCAAMVRRHYADLFRGDAAMVDDAAELGKRLFELSEFLVAFGDLGKVHGDLNARVYFHQSCHLTRELGVTDQPSMLLSKLKGASLVGPERQAPCCGFGGAFSVKFPEISSVLLGDKAAEIALSGADLVAACDMGCLMHIWGGLRRRGSTVPVYHLAEILTGRGEAPSLP